MRHGAAIALLAALLGGGVPAAMAQPDPWAQVTTPVAGAPQSIGSYANGCLVGAVPVPLEGAGYQVIRTSRNRFFAHPTLVAFLEDLGRRAGAAGLGTVLVADVSQPRGGPMPSGHASHQIGLDADIWLRLDVPMLPRPAREVVAARLMVDREAWTVDRSWWGTEQAELIRLAASDPRVARIFVHPAIKQAICEIDWPDRSFLRTLRPWFGHDAHFHVRLHCPADSASCRPQAPPPPGDGCGAELASWFPDPNRPPPPPQPPREPPPLPAACQALIGPAG